MSEPLDDFNRRMTAGSAAWMQGPPRNAAESAAQAMIDARAPAPAGGGGSIDFGARTGAVLLLAGAALFAGGGWLVDNTREGAAMLGILLLIVSAFAMLVGVGAAAVDALRGLGSARGILSVALAGVAAVAGWWGPLRLYWATGLDMPAAILAAAAAAVVFVVFPPR